MSHLLLLLLFLLGMLGLLLLLLLLPLFVLAWHEQLLLQRALWLLSCDFDRTKRTGSALLVFIRAAMVLIATGLVCSAKELLLVQLST